MTRIYLPTTLPVLAEVVDQGEIPQTCSLERFTVDSGDEIEEYERLMQAAVASQELLNGPGRRVVIVAETSSPDVDIGWRAVVAIHADPVERAPDADPDEDLAWYATQEVETLLDR